MQFRTMATTAGQALCRKLKLIKFGNVRRSNAASTNLGGNPRGVFVSACAVMSLLMIAQSHAETAPTTPTGVCLSGGTCYTSGKKFHPGHYMIGHPGNRTLHSTVKGQPYVQGVQVRYIWKNLEKSKGVYDFSVIKSDLDYMKSINKRLVALVVDRVFGTTDPYAAVPSYILKDPIYKGGYAKMHNGVVARVWLPEVMDRQIAMIEALAKQFDGDPNFEAIAVAETAIGIPKDQQAAVGYSISGLAKQLKRLMVAGTAAFQRTSFLQFANYLSTNEMPGIVDNAYRLRGGLGSPDILPFTPHQADRVVLNTPYFNKLPLGWSAQVKTFCQGGTCKSPAVLLDYAVNVLKVNYLFWYKMPVSKDTSTLKLSWDYGILPTINLRQGAINKNCPSNLGGCIGG